MEYVWYRIFNLTEFEALELVSKTYTLDLQNLGEKSFLVTKGNLVSITFDGIILSLDLNDKNPFEFDENAIYVDESDDVYWGMPIES